MTNTLAFDLDKVVFQQPALRELSRATTAYASVGRELWSLFGCYRLLILDPVLGQLIANSTSSYA